MSGRYQSVASGHNLHPQQPIHYQNTASLSTYPYHQRTNDLQTSSYNHAPPPITTTHPEPAVPSRILTSLGTLVTLLEKQNARFESIDARLGKFEQRFEQFSANVEQRLVSQAEADSRRDNVLKSFSDNTLKILRSDIQAAIQPDLQALRKEGVNLREASVTLNAASKQFHVDHNASRPFEQLNGKLLGIDDRLRDMQAASIGTQTLVPLLQESVRQQQQLNTALDAAVRHSPFPPHANAAASSFLAAHQTSNQNHWKPLLDYPSHTDLHDNAEASQTSFPRPTPTSLPPSQPSQSRLQQHFPIAKPSSPSKMPESATPPLPETQSYTAPLPQSDPPFDCFHDGVRDLPSVIAPLAKPPIAIAVSRARRATTRKQASKQQSMITFSAIEEMAEVGAGEPLSPENLAKLHLLASQEDSPRRPGRHLPPPDSSIIDETSSTSAECPQNRLQQLSQVSHITGLTDFTFSSSPPRLTPGKNPLKPVRSPSAASRTSNNGRTIDRTTSSSTASGMLSATKVRPIATKHKKRMISQSDEDTTEGSQSETSRPTKKTKTPVLTAASTTLARPSRGISTTPAPVSNRSVEL